MMNKGKRKGYQKPVIKRVNLAPEEAVLSACKIGLAGENSGGNKVCGHPSRKCVDAGS